MWRWCAAAAKLPNSFRRRKITVIRRSIPLIRGHKFLYQWKALVCDFLRLNNTDLPRIIGPICAVEKVTSSSLRTRSEWTHLYKIAIFGLQKLETSLYHIWRESWVWLTGEQMDRPMDRLSGSKCRAPLRRAAWKWRHHTLRVPFTIRIRPSSLYSGRDQFNGLGKRCEWCPGAVQRGGGRGAPQ